MRKGLKSGRLVVVGRVLCLLEAWLSLGAVILSRLVKLGLQDNHLGIGKGSLQDAADQLFGFVTP